MFAKVQAFLIQLSITDVNNSTELTIKQKNQNGLLKAIENNRRSVIFELLRLSFNKLSLIIIIIVIIQ